MLAAGCDVSYCFWTRFAYGSFQSYAQARYGLFSVTDKVARKPVAQADRHPDLSLPALSSFLGPLVVRLISDATDNIRYAFFFLVFMMWLAVTILLSGNVEQGMTDVRNYHAGGHVDESEL